MEHLREDRKILFGTGANNLQVDAFGTIWCENVHQFVNIIRGTGRLVIQE